MSFSNNNFLMSHGIGRSTTEFYKITMKTSKRQCSGTVLPWISNTQKRVCMVSSGSEDLHVEQSLFRCIEIKFILNFIPQDNFRVQLSNWDFFMCNFNYSYHYVSLSMMNYTFDSTVFFWQMILWLAQTKDDMKYSSR